MLIIPLQLFIKYCPTSNFNKLNPKFSIIWFMANNYGMCQVFHNIFLWDIYQNWVINDCLFGRNFISYFSNVKFPNVEIE